MGKELTIAQLTFVDLYDSYTLSLSSDVIAVPCNPDGEALNTKTYEIKYSIRAGEKMIAAKCESAVLSSGISSITITSSESSATKEGTISVAVKSTTEIPEDSGINISVKTKDSNEFVFNRFISFMNIKSGQDGDSGRGIKTIQEEYAINNSPSQAPAENSSDWGTDPKTPTEDKQYLWNRELLTYDKADEDGKTTSYTTPRIISIYGKDGDPGRGIESIVEYYAVSDSVQAPGQLQIIGGGGTVNVEQYEKNNNNVDDVTLDSDTRYYTINMNSQHSSYSIVKLTFNIVRTTNITVTCVNNGETTWDYMRVSKISTSADEYKFTNSCTQATDTHPDNASTYHCFAGNYNTSGQHHTDPYDVVFSNITPGTYYVYIKVQKDTSTHKEDTYQFKCDEHVASWQTSIPDDYGPDYPYLWNYTCFNYTDGGQSPSNPQVISHWGVDGEPGVSLKLVTDKGSVFKEDIEEITLSLEMYEGLDKINSAVSYIWSRYILDDDNDTWTDIGTGMDNIENICLTVKKSDPLAYSVYKCTITYKGNLYSDYETLTDDVKDIYHAETEVLNDGKDIDGNCAILCVRLYKNGKEIDKPLTERIYYDKNLILNQNSTYGYFYIPGSPSSQYQFFDSTEKTGDYAYFLMRDNMQYFEHTTNTDTAEYALNESVMYEKGTGTHYYNQNFYKDDEGNQTYRLILARYDGSRWRPYSPYDAYEYCYVNHSAEQFGNITFGNSKIFIIDKRKLGNTQIFNIEIYKKIYDNNIPFVYYVPPCECSGDFTVYDLWKIRAYVTGSDTHIISAPCSALQVVKTQYIEEVFSRHTDGVYINQVVTEIGSDGQPLETKPFYVKITSQKMSFGAREYNTDKTAVVNDKEMVYIGNNATNITNSVLEGHTTINGDVIISNTTRHATSKFAIQIENNGSLSLVLA